MGLHLWPPHRAEFAPRSCSIKSSVKMWEARHLSLGLPVVILQLLVPSHARPQTDVHEVGPADRARVLSEFVPSVVPNCDSVFRRSLLSVNKRRQCTGGLARCGAS